LEGSRSFAQFVRENFYFFAKRADSPGLAWTRLDTAGTKAVAHQDNGSTESTNGTRTSVRPVRRRSYACGRRSVITVKRLDLRSGARSRGKDGTVSHFSGCKWLMLKATFLKKSVFVPNVRWTAESNKFSAAADRGRPHPPSASTRSADGTWRIQPQNVKERPRRTAVVQSCLSATTDYLISYRRKCQLLFLH
jgi:hypothetical protein